MKILMVCLGNICRSPIAEGVMKEKMKIYNIEGLVDSAGLLSFHAGDPPDSRAIEISRKNQIDISTQLARQINKSDFNEFDLILTMDRSVQEQVVNMTSGNNQTSKVHLFLEFAGKGNQDVPDPYYGNNDGFRKVFQLIDENCENIIKKIKSDKK